MKGKYLLLVLLLAVCVPLSYAGNTGTITVNVLAAGEISSVTAVGPINVNAFAATAPVGQTVAFKVRTTATTGSATISVSYNTTVANLSFVGSSTAPGALTVAAQSAQGVATGTSFPLVDITAGTHTTTGSLVVNYSYDGTADVAVQANVITTATYTISAS